MKREVLRGIIFGMVVTLSLTFWVYNPVVLAQTLKMPVIAGNVSMSYNVAGVKLPTESEKQAMKIAKSVVQNLFKAINEKQYRVAFDYFSPEIQRKYGYDEFVKSASKADVIVLQYCGVIGYEGDLVILEGRSEDLERSNDGKLDPRLYEYRFAVTKLGNDWKIVEMISEDVTLKHL